MKVGVYVDAFNVYYGARDHCGRNKPGWRWLDIGKLAEEMMAKRTGWEEARVTRLVYCTALREKDGDVSSARDQKTYIRALEQDPRVSVEYGQYNPKSGRGVLIRPKNGGKKRNFERVKSPGQANFPEGYPFGEVRGADGEMHISIHYASYEEKGSDVNLASHLLVDLLRRKIDAAIVISNDGDLRMPLSIARTQIPVGLINPSKRPTSQMLRANRDDGVGSHWWTRLSHKAFRDNQFPDAVNGISRPHGW